MNYTFCALTHPGLVRGNNEDTVVFDEAAGLAILADGMGGYNAGEVASRMAVDLVRAEISRWIAQQPTQASMGDLRAALEASVGHANHAILAAANADMQYAGMGTTLVVGWFQQGRLLMGHIGDSRCYRLRKRHFEQITKDHSLLQEQIDSGYLSAEEAQVSIHRNLLTRALGVEEAVMLDLNEFMVAPGDLYLMCSDGLTDMVTDQEIAKILRVPATLEQQADSLVAAANGNGGRDNISVLLVQAQAKSGGRRLISRLLGK
jgi:protein phosphatase